jgi:RND family efflux transporter MFP subunit
MSEEKKNPAAPAKEHAAAKVFGWLVTAACFGLIGWMAHELMPKGSPKTAAGGPGQGAPTVAVTAEAVTNMPYNPPDIFVAHVEPVMEVDILPQIEGYIKEVKFNEGTSIKQGDLLYLIDDERYAATLEQYKAALAKAETEISSAEAEQDRADRYLKRLRAADTRAITQSDLDKAEADAATTKAAVAQAKAGVLQAKANIAAAEYDMKHTKVYAPITGQIGKTLVHVGDFVAPTKGSMARIVQMDPVRVTFPMTDRAYITWREEVAKAGGHMQQNRRMRLILPNGSLYNRDGEWAFDDNEMSASTATILMRSSFPNPDKVLIPNTYVKLASDLIQPPSYPSVPETAILDFTDGVGLWVMKPDGTAEKRLVKVIGTYKGFSAIGAGVKEGETVVDEGCHKVMPGVKLTVVDKSHEEKAVVR